MTDCARCPVPIEFGKDATVNFEGRVYHTLCWGQEMQSYWLVSCDRVSALEKQLQEERAGAAAMREALEKLCTWAANPLPQNAAVAEEWRTLVAEVRNALASPAGREYAERMQRAEARAVELEDRLSIFTKGLEKQYKADLDAARAHLATETARADEAEQNLEAASMMGFVRVSLVGERVTENEKQLAAIGERLEALKVVVAERDSLRNQLDSAHAVRLIAVTEADEMREEIRRLQEALSASEDAHATTTRLLNAHTRGCAAAHAVEVAALRVWVAREIAEKIHAACMDNDREWSPRAEDKTEDFRRGARSGA